VQADKTKLIRAITVMETVFMTFRINYYKGKNK